MKIYVLLFLLLSYQSVICQPSSVPPDDITQDSLYPRIGDFADSQGSYSLSVQLSKHNLEKLDTLNLSCLITGYGFISNAKLNILPSLPLFDSTSYVNFGYRINEKNQIVTRTDEPQYLDYTNGATLILGGPHLPKWTAGTSFFDIYTNRQNGTSTISSEVMEPNPLFLFHYKLKNNTVVGDHYFTVIFTYFDGRQWRNDKQIISFHVDDWYERNPWFLFIFLPIITILFTLLIGVNDVWDLIFKIKQISKPKFESPSAIKLLASKEQSQQAEKSDVNSALKSTAFKLSKEARKEINKANKLNQRKNKP